MAKKAPQPRKRRTPRPWWRRPLALNAAQTVVVTVGVGVFLSLTVNSFDMDEIKELGAATVIRLFQKA